MPPSYSARSACWMRVASLTFEALRAPAVCMALSACPIGQINGKHTDLSPLSLEGPQVSEEQRWKVLSQRVRHLSECLLRSKAVADLLKRCEHGSDCTDSEHRALQAAHVLEDLRQVLHDDVCRKKHLDVDMLWL